MIPRSSLPALLLIGVLSMLACQFLRPARPSCRVNMPTVGWKEYWDGDEISFTVDKTEWRARVDCTAGHMVEGQPVRPADGRKLSLTVEGTVYKLTTTEASLSMTEYRENGSHIRIDMDDRYYVAVLTASSGSFGKAMVSYFMGGQAADNMVRLYCYNQTEGQEHASLPAISSMWNESKPVTVSFVCSAHDFILELSTEITPEMLKHGPKLPPITPVPTITPAPFGQHADSGSPPGDGVITMFGS